MMADNDYLCVYRQFFEEFAKTSEKEDNTPMRLNLYSIAIDELLGEVMHYCINFLSDRQCPRCLIVPLTKVVVEEFLNEAKKQPEEVNTPLKLNSKALYKISEVCRRYTDNEKLSSLPGPVQETPFSIHATKHIKRRMEDRLICLPRFNAIHGVQTNSEAGYYGIFDGHAGVNAACFTVSHLHQFLVESEHYPENPVQAFRQAYDKTENRYNAKDDNSGTTALAILHQPTEKKLIVSWIGDSQAMLVTDDCYIMLVDPHKPDRGDELKRIQELGGFVAKIQEVSRVNGGLAISRAIGDKKLKPFVSAEPEFRVLNLTGAEHFVVMGSDGLWDVVSPEEVIETVYFEVNKNEGQVESVARRLVDLAKENNSTDNISVIVFFLTDPTEIKNRSVDINGHRPKIVNQDGVIMEADFETSEKLPSPDSATNGLLETNGNHLIDHLKNESDEDFGPETDVDAVDDVLSSPKSLNPFASDCWPKQQMAMNNGEKLIEMTRQETIVHQGGEEILKFSDEFEGSMKDVDVKGETDCTPDPFNVNYLSQNDDGMQQIRDEEISVNDVNRKNNQDGGLSGIEELSFNDRKEDFNSIKGTVDNVNQMEPSLVNNYSEVLNFTSNGLNDSNKYLEEINFEKKEFDSFNFGGFNEKPNESNLPLGQPNDLDNNSKNDIDIELKVELENGAIEPFSPDPEKKDLTENHGVEIDRGFPEESMLRESNLSDRNEASSPMMGEPEKGASEFGIEPEITRQIIPESMTEKLHIDEEPTNEKFDLEPNKMDTKLFIEEPPLDTAPQEIPLDASGNPPVLCSVIDSEAAAIAEAVAAAAAAASVETETSNQMFPATDLKEEESPTAFSQPALIPDGEAKDEAVVAESGGEAEDSEDDEWNYIKVESDVQAPVDKPLDLVEPKKQSFEEEKEQSTMNSPLNPDAAEFIPVAPVSVGQEFSGETPIKAIPQDLSDIVSSSPNWTNMENVKVPEESAFLHDIKSRPGNIFEDIQAPPQKEEDFNDFMAEQNQIKHTPEMENEMVVPAPRGIDLASDMTSSFIDPSTMSSSPDVSKEPLDFFKAENVVEPVAQKVEISLTEQSYQQFENEAIVPESNPDLLSPVSVEEVTASPVSPETPKSTGVEASLSPGSEPFTPEISQPAAATEVVENTVAPTLTSPQKENEILEKPLVEDNKNNEVISNVAAPVAAAATAAVAAVATAAVASKDVKKPATKTTTPSKPTKTSATTKPLLNGTKTSTTTKKPLSSSQVTKTTATATAKAPSTISSATKTPTPRVSSVTKTTTRTTNPVTAATATNKTQARPKTATPTAAKTSSLSRTVTSTTTRTSLTSAPKPPAPRTSTISSTATTPKPKPRVPSAPIDKKLNGDVKPAAKHTETTTTTITKKPNSTTTTTTTTRLSLTSRPATAPLKSTTVKSTMTVTRTITAKPRTTFTSTTATSTVTNSSRVSSITRKSNSGPDKQAKETANRLTLKSTAAKTNGLPHTTTTTVTKTRKTLTPTTTPSKTKTDNKTEIKAEKIINETVEIIQSNNISPLIENKDINLINSITSN